MHHKKTTILVTDDDSSYVNILIIIMYTHSGMEWWNIWWVWLFRCIITTQSNSRIQRLSFVSGG